MVETRRLFLGGVSYCICTIYHNGKARVMMVDDVFTDPRCRRQGHGGRLMQEAVRFAQEKEVDSIELLVNGDNAAAKSLYEKAGFERTDKEHYRMILNKWETK